MSSNTPATYQSSSHLYSKVISKGKVFKKWGKLQGQGHRVKNNGTQGKVLSNSKQNIETSTTLILQIKDNFNVQCVTVENYRLISRYARHNFRTGFPVYYRVSALAFYFVQRLFILNKNLKLYYLPLTILFLIKVFRLQRKTLLLFFGFFFPIIILFLTFFVQRTFRKRLDRFS